MKEKIFMKKSWMPVGIICIALSLTACSASAENETSAESSILSADIDESVSNEAEENVSSDVEEAIPAEAEESVPNETAKSVFSESDETSSPEKEGLPYGRPVDFDSDSLPADIAHAIENYCYNGTFPDGQEGGAVPDRISYAVYDIDKDGKDELILQNSDTFMSGMTERIYSCQDGIFREELSEFPVLTYYDNGIIQAEWSHNQGLSGERLWPYNLYRYQPETDNYELLGSVDAWDRERADFDNYLGAFPDEIDIDKDGYVYFLLSADWEGQIGRAHV